MNRRYWTKKLKEAEKELGFSDGYRFIYGPWDMLDKATVAFLSLNPGMGRAPEKATMRCISDERGNTYEIEQEISKSPIIGQFLRLAKLLGHQPVDILTGVVAPFRSSNWDDLEKYQKEKSLALGREFWKSPLSRPGLRLIIASSKPAEKLVVEITGALLEGSVSAGWDKQELRRYRLPQGGRVVYLPHLSRFQLLGREPSEQKLCAFLDNTAAL